MSNIVVAFQSFYFVLTIATDPRSVSVAFETSLIFQPGEDNTFSFINKIRSFIDQIEKAISPGKAYLRTNNDKKDYNIFSKFLEKLTINIVKYNDRDLENVAKILANEVENFLNDKDIFTENTRKLLSKILFEYSKLSPKQIRFNLKNALDGNEIIIIKLADKINDYFNESDKVKLNDLIEKSNKFSNVNLESRWEETRNSEIKRVVEEFLNILYEKFKTLDDVTKMQLNRDIGSILQYLDMSRIYINDVKNQLEYRRKLTENNDLKENTIKSNKNDILVNKDIDLFVKSINYTNNGLQKIDKEENNDSNNNDLNFNKIVNESVDLSTILDELSRSWNI